MADIETIVLQVKTGSKNWSGTDDWVYLGVFGTNGGREFCLDSAANDFESGSDVHYVIGADSDIGTGEKRVPLNAGLNAFQSNKIGLTEVTSVYLRKQGNQDADVDDAWEVETAFVYMFNSKDAFTRVFVSRGRTSLEIESGLQVWLAEQLNGG